MAEPTHSSQVLVDDGNRAFVVQWLRKYKQERPGKCLLLLGPTGCGKSTLVDLCLAENLYTPIRVDALHYKGRQGLERELRDAERNPLRQAALVEDPQRLAPDGGLLVLSRFAKKATRVPVVVICDATKKTTITPLLSACETVVFRPMPATRLSQHFGVDRKLCTRGDLRQICMARTVRLPQSERDFHMGLNEAAERALAGYSVSEHNSRGDDHTLVNMMQTNHVHLFTQGDRLQDCTAAAEDLSEADLVPTTGDAGVSDEVFGILGLVRPGQRTAAAPRKLHPDVVWTKAATGKMRGKVLRDCTHAFNEAGNGLGLEALSLVQAKWLEAAREERWDTIRAWAPGASVQQLTGLMRLKLGRPYPESALSKMRRALVKLGLPKS